MVSSARLAGIGVTAVLVLAACSSDPEPTPTGTAPTSVSPTASASPTDTPSGSTTASPTGSPEVPAGFDLQDKTGGGFPDLGDDVGPGEGVRVGRHTGYDRVVFDFADTGTPSYRVRYVDTPVADGSGDPVDVAGEAYLEVLVTTVSIPADGQTPPPDSSAADLQGTVVAEADAIFGGFEGYGQSFIGVRGQERPFRVSLERSPTRLVIDIAR